jgi:DNA polymerase
VSEKITAFFRKVSKCTLCHGTDSIYVPKPSQMPERGSNPRVFILGEQPDPKACLASGLSGIDQEGPSVVRLRKFLRQAGIDEADVFFTTSVLCIPREPSMRGARPSPAEAKSCTRHIEKLLALVRPRVIVPVGHTAIQSIQWIYQDWTELRQFILNYDVGNVLVRNDLAVYPLYHTSTSTLRARPQDRQERDWRRLGSILESIGSVTPAE